MPRRADARDAAARSEAPTQTLTAEQTAWLLLLPALALAVLAIGVLGPPLGRLAFTGTDYTYWPSAARALLEPKPTELARFALTVVCALGFALAIPFAAARPPRLRPAHAHAAVVGVQVVLVAALAVFWFEQRNVEPFDLDDPTYFTPLATVVACAFAALGAVALSRPEVLARLRAIPADRRGRVACGAAAALATVLWLLPSIFTDDSIAFASNHIVAHLRYSFDESMSVLDGRSPLVDMTTYGALVPYVVALPLAAFGGSLAAFTTLMVLLTVCALMALYALLRRLTRNPLAALALYLPIVATSLFIVRGETVERFDFGNYFGIFPIRYAGPYLLVWLTVRHVDGERPRSAVPLFAVAGLVVLNNTDFGLPALGATLAAVVCARPPRTREAVLALAGRIAAGLAIALSLVSLLTLLRADTLPHLGRLFDYARLFGVAGFGNLPTPLLGFHLVILATFVGAAATAAVRVARPDADATLTAALAWCGVFGICSGAYFAYRSHPDTLIAHFSIWALTLAVLLVAVVRGAFERGRLAPSPPVLALLVGCGIAVCSLAQFPLPWLQVERIARSSSKQPLRQPEAVRLVRRFAPPGATVAILAPLGHRLAYDADVTSVAAYTGLPQMPTVEQFEQTLAALRAAGGRLVFVGQPFYRELPRALARAGFTLVGEDPASELVAVREGG